MDNILIQYGGKHNGIRKGDRSIMGKIAKIWKHKYKKFVFWTDNQDGYMFCNKPYYHKNCNNTGHVHLGEVNERRVKYPKKLWYAVKTVRDNGKIKQLCRGTAIFISKQEVITFISFAVNDSLKYTPECNKYLLTYLNKTHKVKRPKHPLYKEKRRGQTNKIRKRTKRSKRSKRSKRRSFRKR